MGSLAKPRRKVYSWSSPLSDWEWGQELKQQLEVIEERRLREKETKRGDDHERE